MALEVKIVLPTWNCITINVAGNHSLSILGWKIDRGKSGLNPQGERGRCVTFIDLALISPSFCSTLVLFLFAFPNCMFLSWRSGLWSRKIQRWSKSHYYLESSICWAPMVWLAIYIHLVLTTTLWEIHSYALHYKGGNYSSKILNNLIKKENTSWM